MIVRIGPSMGIDLSHPWRFVTALGLLVGLAANAGAARNPLEPLARVGLVDVRGEADAVVVGDALLGDQPLRFFRLSGAPGRGIECCLRPEGMPGVATRVQLYGAGPEEAQPVAGRTAKLTVPFDDVFIGFALQGPDARVHRVNRHRVVVSWLKQKGKVQIDHCLSAEGLHLRLKDVSSRSRTAHYYVALGMDVEPTCGDTGIDR